MSAVTLSVWEVIFSERGQQQKKKAINKSF